MDLEVRWYETDAGSYPTIVLTWEDAMRGAPGKYLAKCEDALFEFEHGERPPPRLIPWWADDELEEAEEG